MGICKDPAWWRGQLLHCFGGTVNRMDVVSYWFIKIKTFDRCEERMEAQGISFCRRKNSWSSLMLGVWVRAHLGQCELFPGFQWALEKAH